MSTHIYRVAVVGAVAVVCTLFAGPANAAVVAPASIADRATAVGPDYYFNTPFVLWFYTPCGPDRDGEVQEVYGELWECAFVGGDDPEWQWEPISRVI